jgi:hypothetical protein
MRAVDSAAMMEFGFKADFSINLSNRCDECVVLWW